MVVQTTLPASAGSFHWPKSPRWDRSVRRCEQCGGEYTPKRPEQRWCTTQCRNAAKTDSRYGSPKSATCRQCHAVFQLPRGIGQHSRRYCSSECNQAGKARARHECEWDGCNSVALYGRKLCSPHRNYARSGKPCAHCGRLAQGTLCKPCLADKRAASSPVVACVVPWAKCATCGADYVRRRGRRHCYPHVTRSGLPSTYVRKVERWVSCGRCDGPVWSRIAKVYCDECKRDAKRDAKHTRRARMKAIEPVGLNYLLKRDGGKCQLCRKRVDATKVVPHPKAPTTDHIVPLSLGGRHERRNCQLAHFMCNTLKSNRGTDQLRLIG